MRDKDLIDALQYAVERLEKGEAQKYIERSKKDSECMDVRMGMYFAIDSISNSLFAFLGDDAKQLGFERLARKLGNTQKQ